MKRPSIDELLRGARLELDTNPTITAYVMVDGREVHYDPRLGFVGSVMDLIQTAINDTLRTLCDIIGLGSSFIDELAAVFP